MSAQTPHVRLGTTTRAGGKIFIALEGAPKDATLLSQAHTPAGLSVPSKVYAMETGERVLVLPVLGVAQEVRLFGRDAAGTETSSGEGEDMGSSYEGDAASSGESAGQDSGGGMDSGSGGGESME